MEQSKNLHKNPTYSRKTHRTAGSIWIISSLCLFANIHVIPSVSGLHLSFAANENGVVNIQFNKKAELNISINVDSADFGSESSDIIQSDCKLPAIAEPKTAIGTTEQTETVEQIETTKEPNPKDLILQSMSIDDENEVKRLIAKYYDGDMDGDHNIRPLSAAAERCKIRTAKMLIDNGADIEIGSPGWTPLHVAAFNDCENIVNELIKSGANLNAKTQYSETALDIARRHGRHEIEQILSQLDPSTSTEHYTSTPPPSTTTFCTYFGCDTDKSNDGSGDEFEDNWYDIMNKFKHLDYTDDYSSTDLYGY